MSNDTGWLRQMADEEDKFDVTIGADAIRFNAAGIMAQNLARVTKERDEAHQLIKRLQQSMWALANSPLTSDDSKHYLTRWEQEVKGWLDSR